MSFLKLNLNPNIHKAITARGYTIPTEIQARSIPEILLGHDVVACAPTGTGKTAAFILPALHKLSLASSKKTRVLILTPTRELASQITESTNLYGKFLQQKQKFNFVNLVGGMRYEQQIKELSRGADIIVATPGRLLDHIQSRRVYLSHIEMLVLDEADRMLSMGFIDDVQEIASLTPKTRQTLLFSATIDKKLQNVIRNLLKNPRQINLATEKTTSPQIAQEIYKTKNIQHKASLLEHLLKDAQIFKAIIFSATKANADKLSIHLRNQGHAAAALHGDLRQNVRNRTTEQFRRGKIQFLVATDVAARGIDVKDITHVINYDLPRDCEDYVHRIGRTGRAGKTGIAISFVTQKEMSHLQKIERYIGQRIKVVTHQLDEKNKLDFYQEDTSYHPRSTRSAGDTQGRRRFTGTTLEKSSSNYAQKSERKSFGKNEEKEGRSFTRNQSSRPRSFRESEARDFERSEHRTFARGEEGERRGSRERNEERTGRSFGKDARPFSIRGEGRSTRPFEKSERSFSRRGKARSARPSEKSERPFSGRGEERSARPSEKSKYGSFGKSKNQIGQKPNGQEEFKKNSRIRSKKISRTENIGDIKIKYTKSKESTNN